MLIGILADIHGNREALDAVLGRLSVIRADRLILLGDIVGYGPDPSYVVETAIRLRQAGAVCLLGNHDEAAVGEPLGMTEDARDAIRWTQRQLSQEHQAFLAGLPLTHMEADVLFTHASASRRGKWVYVRDADAARDCLAGTDARTVLCGHTHIPAIFYCGEAGPVTTFTPLANKPAPLFAGRRQVVVAGSVGQPRDGNPAACLAMLDTQAMTVTMLRVPYDSSLTAGKIQAAGLPSWLGNRLMIGR